jgi:hypothetical protein
MAGAGAGVGVLAFVDAGVDSVVPPAAAPVDVIDANPKTEPGAAVVVVDVVVCDDVRDGEPNEKPTLPALGGGGDDPSLAPGDTPNPNCAGVAADAAVPKVNGDDFGDAPNDPPNRLLGGAGAALSFSLLSLLSFSSADFVDAPNMLLEPEGPVVASLKSFVPGAMEKENGAGGGTDEAGFSLSLSFSSGATLSEPKSVEAFGGLPKSKVLVPGRLLLPPPKENVPEVLEGANAPREKGGFNEGVDSASFDV